jgi:DNA-binding PucR family transcriptional regulator
VDQTQPADPIRTETLYAVIGAIADGPDLDRVLRAVVDLLADATACHACFIYLREGDRLRIRAASPVFEHAVGKVVLRIGEGLTGWVARNRTPAFIRDAALDDPRMAYVPELEEERFQSMIAVPLIDRLGDVTGVVVLHTQAPREFGQDVLDLLVHVAALVAGAIDNARLYDQTQRQVAALSALNKLSQQFTALTSPEELYDVGCVGIRELLEADSCVLAIHDAEGALASVATSPSPAEHDRQHHPIQPSAEGGLTAQLVEADRQFGLIRVTRSDLFTEDDSRLLQTAANQLASALRTAERIQRLETEGIVRQVFDAMERGNDALVATRLTAAGWELDDAHVVIVCRPTALTSPLRQEELQLVVEERLRSLAPNALIDARSQLRAVTPLGRTGQSDAALSRLRDQLAEIGAELNVGFGISRPRQAFADVKTILLEADDTARVTAALTPRGGAQGYDDLGAYRFMIRLIDSQPPKTPHAQALRTLAEYDHRRHAALLDTLDAYLDARGAARVAARSLVIHPNTLRQRLDRIEDLTSLRLDDEDLLSLQLSLKLHRLGSSFVTLSAAQG